MSTETRSMVGEGGPEGPVPDRVIDEVYRGILRLHRDATIELAVQMGRLIIEGFFGGRFEPWREHGPKETSLRRLAARFDTGDAPGLSATGIHRVISIYEMEHRLQVSVRKHLTLTHVRAVIGLPPDDQSRLLAAAEAKRWTTRVFETKVARVRREIAGGRGRPPLPAFLKTTNLLSRVAADQNAFADLDLVAGMEKEQAEKILLSMSSLEDRLTALKERLMERLAR